MRRAPPIGGFGYFTESELKDLADTKPRFDYPAVAATLRSPAHGRAQVCARPKRDGPETIKSATLAAVFDAENFDQYFVTYPEADLNTKEGRQSDFDYRQKHTGKTFLTDERFDTINEISGNLISNPLAQILFDEGEAGKIARFTDPKTRVGCQTTVDFNHDAHALLACIELVPDASPAGFERFTLEHNLHIKAGFLSIAWQLIENSKLPPDLLFFVVEATPPYGVAVYKLDAATLKKGIQLCEQALKIYGQCLDKGEWPSYDTDQQVISLPLKG